MKEKHNVVLVTGANSGIGLACVKKFLNNNWRVIAHYHSCADNLNEINSDNLSIVQADFDILSEVQKTFYAAYAMYGQLDVLINNAGVFTNSQDIEELAMDDIQKVIDVNFKAPFVLSQLAMKKMKERGYGRVINISSVGVKYGGNPYTASYTISKAALEAATYLFAKAGASYNVLVNTIRVGVTNTDIHKQNPSKNLEARQELIPLKRWAAPEEIANSVFFLASEESSFITGSLMTVAGGE